MLLWCCRLEVKLFVGDVRGHHVECDRLPRLTTEFHDERCCVVYLVASIFIGVRGIGMSRFCLTGGFGWLLGCETLCRLRVKSLV